MKTSIAFHIVVALFTRTVLIYAADDGSSGSLPPDLIEADAKRLAEEMMNKGDGEASRTPPPQANQPEADDESSESSESSESPKPTLSVADIKLIEAASAPGRTDDVQRVKAALARVRLCLLH